MARVTVEDCIENIPNRFDLVLVAAQRAKQISSGNPITVDRDNDKDAVVSLREIADRTISLPQLQEDTINAFCKRQAVDIADQKAVAAEDEMQMEVAQAFQDAGRHLVSADEVDGEIEDAEDAGVSFEGEDVQTDD